MTPPPPPGGFESADLPARFAAELQGVGSPARGDRVLVALSGGLDSLVLLHLLRFRPHRLGLDVLAAHFDHRMRAGSREDALWVRGLCRAWGVSLRTGEADAVPASEEEAREARYRYLLKVKEEVGARWLLTAHHADDQAETVLFRVLRGTGLPGLAGIPRKRSPGILRPLLAFTRKELARYARVHGIRPRTDPSNTDTRFARNFLRHRLLPEAEDRVAPGARRALVRLARLARDNEVAWESLLPLLTQGVLEEGEGRVFIVRSALLAYHPAVQARLLREAFRRKGIALDEAGTRRVLEFTRTGASGRYLTLQGGYRISRDFDRFSILLEESAQGDRPLDLLSPWEGSGEALVGGRRVGIRWGPAHPGGCQEILALDAASVEFPLTVRGRIDGDRIFLGFGSKKLKKLFAERKIPTEERRGLPVLVDGRGRVLWVPGVATSAHASHREGRESFFIGIVNVESG